MKYLLLYIESWTLIYSKESGYKGSIIQREP